MCTFPGVRRTSILDCRHLRVNKAQHGGMWIAVIRGGREVTGSRRRELGQPALSASRPGTVHGSTLSHRSIPEDSLGRAGGRSQPGKWWPGEVSVFSPVAQAPRRPLLPATSRSHPGRPLGQPSPNPRSRKESAMAFPAGRKAGSSDFRAAIDGPLSFACILRFQQLLDAAMHKRRTY